jgi:hypothetical protein
MLELRGDAEARNSGIMMGDFGLIWSAEGEGKGVERRGDKHGR